MYVYVYVCIFIYVYVCLGNDSLPPKEALLTFATYTWQKLVCQGKKGGDETIDDIWQWKKLLIRDLTAQNFKL